jgi:SSS family solute:Na+ symporter
MPGLHILDYLVVFVYLTVIVAIGGYFARKQNSTDEYFTGGRNIPAWALGMSLLATVISSVTFLAYPGEGYASNWIRLVQGIMVPISLLGIIWFVVPCYRRIIGLSAYEYFEKRFGYFARLYSSLAFVLAHFSKMGTVFYLLALAISKMTGYDTYMVILVVGILTVLYTLLGGIEAVVWSDVIQGFMLIAGGLICAGVLLFRPEGGPAEIIERAWENNKISAGPYDMDFTKLTFIVMALNGIFYAIQKYGTDQTVVQRFLAAKSDKAAIKAALMGTLLCVPVWTLFMFIGTCLWSYYQGPGFSLPKGIKADAVFPHFIMTELPAGITGLILAALIAAAMSSLDSDLNCLAAVGVSDFYLRFKPRSSDKQCLKAGRNIVVVCGICAMAVAFWYIRSEGTNVLKTVFTLYAIFSGGIAGLFLLAFFTTRANTKGLYVGIAACVLFTGYALLTSGGFIDLGRYNFTHHKYMLGVYSHLVLFGVGYLASFFFKPNKDIRHMTFLGWLERRRNPDIRVF